MGGLPKPRLTFANEELGPMGHPVLFDKEYILLAKFIRAEPLVIQALKKEALALMEGIERFSSYSGDYLI